MWNAKYEKVFKGLTKESVWSAWADVNNWSQWDGDIEYAKINVPFEVGNKFVLKPKGGPKVSIQLVTVAPLSGFTDVTKFPFAKMYDTHEIEETPDGLKLKSQIRVEGPLGWLWKKIVAQGVADGVPKQMEALVQFIQKTSQKAPVRAAQK
jgi:hypothetical protein